MMVPSGSLPEPEKNTDCPAVRVTLVAGLVMCWSEEGPRGQESIAQTAPRKVHRRCSTGTAGSTPEGRYYRSAAR